MFQASSNKENKTKKRIFFFFFKGMSVSPIDRELLKRVYAKFDPSKVGSVEEILAKRKGNEKELQEMWGFLEKKFNFNAKQWRAQVEADLGVAASGSPKQQHQQQGVASPKSPAASLSPRKLATPTPSSPSSPPPSKNPAASSTAASAATAAAKAASSLGGAAELEQRTIQRVQKLLIVGDPEKAANAAALVQSLHGSKAGLNERSANQLIKTLEKRLGVTEEELEPSAPSRPEGGASNTPSAVAASAAKTSKTSKGAAETTENSSTTSLPSSAGASSGAPTSDLGAFAKQWSGFGGGGSSTADPSTATAFTSSSSSSSSSSKLKPHVARLIHDGFGILPENQRAAASRRPALSQEERLYYEELLRPSIALCCASDAQDEIDEATTELLLRCEAAALNPRMADECATTRDVCDRVLRALQSKYEHRNPGGRRDFFAKFIPTSSASPAPKNACNKSSNTDNAVSNIARGSDAYSFVSPDSNPMQMSRLIAQNTLASSLIPSSSFLGEDPAWERKNRLDGGPATADLGPLPFGESNDGSGEDKNNRSFSTLLTSAMKFLHSSSIETITPHSDKEILPAVFVVECLEWADVVSGRNNKNNENNNNNSDNNNYKNNDSASSLAATEEKRRDLFKLALSQDIAEILGWGELLEHSGKHNWRNVTIKQFTLSMAGNVHAEAEIVIPAGISVDDLKSLVYSRLKTGGFTLPRARVSLARDLEARPAKLFCRSANFGDQTRSHRDSIIPETVFDEKLGVHISPHHRNSAASRQSASTMMTMTMPVQGTERQQQQQYYY